jgi:hypothetical protein
MAQEKGEWNLTGDGKVRKLICLFTLVSLSMAAAPREAHFFTLGPWTMCSVMPQYCVAPGEETYVVLAIASSPDVLAFRYRVRYLQDGVEKTASGLFERADADTGYSASVPIRLGKIALPVAGLEVSELVVRP